MTDKIRFTIQRSSWADYEAEKPEGFDDMDKDEQWLTLVELADAYNTTELAGETTQLDVFIGDEGL